MIVFRWVMGVIAGLLASGALLGLALGIAFDSRIWLDRVRALRHALWVVALLWFNIEVWGRVVMALVRWGR